MRAGIAIGAWLGLTLGLAGGCGEEPAEPPRVNAPAPPDDEAEPERGADVEAVAEPEAGDEDEPEDDGPPKRVFAKRFVVNVRSEPDRQAQRIGYLRAGAALELSGRRPAGQEGCLAGWYELSTGGYVCNRRDVTVFEGSRLPERRSEQPDRAARLPYRYGYINADRTPLYNRLPNDEEAARFEGYRIPGAEPPAAAAGPAGEGAAPAAPTPAAEAGPAVAAAEAPSEAPPAVPIQAPTKAPAAAPAPAAGAATPPAAQAGGGPADDEGEEEPLTLASLAGSGDGVLDRWLMRGFHVSLDTTMRAAARRYWRTQQNGFVPIRRIRHVRGSMFRGVVLVEAGEGEVAGEGADASPELDDDDEEPVIVDPHERGWRLPVGFVMSKRSAWYERQESGRLVRRRGIPGYHHAFPIVDEYVERGRTYWVDHEGNHYDSSECRRADAAEPPDEAQEGEHWIDVNLEQQTLVAYEGTRPVFVTLVSSGRRTREQDPEQWETPTGIFRVKSKHLTSSMDGDSAIDGPYSIDDVPYVMYFHAAYALHGAFWHNLFGRPKSHGCVNLSPIDSRWLWRWAGPSIPDGWHGAYPHDDNPGTLIVIRGETPRTWGIR